MANTKPIPKKMREDIARDRFMSRCIYKNDNAPNHDCQGRIEWEHSHLFAGKRINEPWAIVPCCTNHNRGNAMDKEYNRYIALVRATILLPDGLEDLKRRYPTRDWDQQFKYLRNKYGEQELYCS
jgi:hypothetical protein